MESLKKGNKLFYSMLICSLGILVALLIVSCATIIHGSRQSVTLNSVPSGVNVIRQGAHIATTPAVVELPRNSTNVILTFEKDGYEPVEIILNRKVDGWIVGNIVFGGLIGLAVDFISGAAYKLSPSEVNAALKELKAQGFDINENAKNNLIVVVDMQAIQGSR